MTLGAAPVYGHPFRTRGRRRTGESVSRPPGADSSRDASADAPRSPSPGEALPVPHRGDRRPTRGHRAPRPSSSDHRAASRRPGRRRAVRPPALAGRWRRPSPGVDYSARRWPPTTDRPPPVRYLSRDVPPAPHRSAWYVPWRSAEPPAPRRQESDRPGRPDSRQRHLADRHPRSDRANRGCRRRSSSSADHRSPEHRAPRSHRRPRASPGLPARRSPSRALQ